MRDGAKMAVHDEELGLEAYRLCGFARPFPPHFHDYYSVGVVEAGSRLLLLRGRRAEIGAGDIVVFNPGDAHSCEQEGPGVLEYRGLNVPVHVLMSAVERLEGVPRLVSFRNVVRDERVFAAMREFHVLVGAETGAKARRAAFDEAMAALMLYERDDGEEGMQEGSGEDGSVVERASAYMERRLPDRVVVRDVCEAVGVSESTLLRAFVRERGITPYRHLESMRVVEARRLLEEGFAPAQAAALAGFSDQSHFTNRFRDYTGLTPAAYASIFKGNDSGGGSCGQ